MRTQLESAGSMGEPGGGSSTEFKERARENTSTRREAGGGSRDQGPRPHDWGGGGGLGLIFSELQPGKRGVAGADP